MPTLQSAPPDRVAKHPRFESARRALEKEGFRMGATRERTILAPFQVGMPFRTPSEPGVNKRVMRERARQAIPSARVAVVAITHPRLTSREAVEKANNVLATARLTTMGGYLRALPHRSAKKLFPESTRTSAYLVFSPRLPSNASVKPSPLAASARKLAKN